jgi:hypothetical protein
VRRASRAAITTLVLATSISCSRDSVRDTRPEWLLDRAREQRVLALGSPAIQDFHFTDRLAASGISFVMRVVDDAGKAYKPMHYDHGTGVCAADVDADGLPDLYFVTQLGTNELWMNLGGGTFWNETSSAGLSMPDAIAVGCSFADVDNDGLPDLFVTTVRHGNRLFRNQGGGKFQDITAQAGVGYVGHSSGGVFFDYDGDGLLDLFVANVGIYTTSAKGPGDYFIGMPDAFHGHTHPERTEASILYRNLGGGRFEDVTQKTGLVDESWSGDAVVMDANRDGRPDLFVLDMQGENHLWLNDDGAHFHDATSSYFAKTSWGAMGAKVFDADGDGHLDLLVTDMHSDMFNEVQAGDWITEALKSDPSRIPDDMFPAGRTRLLFGNALYKRTTSTDTSHFEDISERFAAETYWPWGPSVDDVNADGWDDAFITAGMNFPFRYGINSMLLNESGKRFAHAEFTLELEPRVNGEMQEWMRLDCAGADRGNKTCEVCSKPNAEAVGCRGDAKGTLTMLAPRGSRSSLIADLDGDGDLDIVTNDFNGAPRILISDLTARHTIHFLKVRLKGSRSNRGGVGAVVAPVLPNHRRIVKVMDGKSGYLSQSALPLYFGLGNADHVDAIEVQWPSGHHQVVAGPIASGGTIDITEP